MASDSRLFQEAMKRGSAHAWGGRWAHAAEEFRLALKQVPEDISARTQMALALFRSGQLQESLELYQALWKAQPASLPMLLRVAELQAALGDRESAVISYRLLAEIHGRRRAPKEALKAWQKVVELKPDSALFWGSLMDTALQVGSVAEFIPGYLVLARNLALGGRFEDALRVAERAQVADPSNPAVLSLATALRRGLEYSWRAAAQGEEPTPEELARIIPPIQLPEQQSASSRPAGPPAAREPTSPSGSSAVEEPPAPEKPASAAPAWTPRWPGDRRPSRPIQSPPPRREPAPVAREKPVAPPLPAPPPSRPAREEDAPVALLEPAAAAVETAETAPAPPVALPEPVELVVEAASAQAEAVAETAPAPAVVVEPEPVVSVASVPAEVVEAELVPIEPEPQEMASVPEVGVTAAEVEVVPETEPAAAVEPGPVEFAEPVETVESPPLEFEEPRAVEPMAESEADTVAEPEAAEPAESVEAEPVESGVVEPAVPALAVDSRPSQADLLSRAREARDSGWLRDAVLLLETALSMGPPSSDLFVDLAVLHQQLGRGEEAERTCRQALELAPDSPVPLLMLARMRLAEGQLDLAEEYVRRGLETAATVDEKTFQEGLELLLDILEERAGSGDLAAVAGGLAWARNRAYGSPVAAATASRLAAAPVELLGQCAGEHLEEVMRLPVESRLRVLRAVRRAEEQVRQGHPRPAADEMYGVAMALPDFLPAQSLLGRVLVAQGRIEEAGRRTQRLLSLYDLRGETAQALEVMWWMVAQRVGGDDVRARLVTLLRAQHRTEEAELVKLGWSEPRLHAAEPPLVEWAQRPEEAEAPPAPRGQEGGEGELLLSESAGTAESSAPPPTRVVETPMAPDERAGALSGTVSAGLQQLPRDMLQAPEASPAPEAPPRTELLESKEEALGVDSSFREAAEPAEAVPVGLLATEDVFEPEGEPAGAKEPPPPLGVEARVIAGFPAWESLLTHAETRFANGDRRGAMDQLRAALEGDKIVDAASRAAFLRILVMLGQQGGHRAELTGILKRFALPEDLAS